jgi:hypothetical protein
MPLCLPLDTLKKHSSLMLPSYLYLVIALCERNNQIQMRKRHVDTA